MWDQRNALYASADQEELPLTREGNTTWEKCKRWVTRHPLASALFALVAVGGIVAIIVGPVISSQRKGSKEVNEQAAVAIDFKMTLQAQSAPHLCANFSNARFLSSYTTTLQASVASILAAQPSQIGIQSVQCDSKTYDLNSASTRHRHLQEISSSGADNARILLVVTFRILPLGRSSNSSTSGTSSSAGGGSFDDVKVLQSQLQSSSLILQQAVSQALGLPSASVVLVSIETSGQQSEALSPPLLPPPPLSSGLPAPPPFQHAPPESVSQYSASPPLVPMAGHLVQPSSPPELAPAPATYPPPPFLLPLYGGEEPSPSISQPPTAHQQPPAYGSSSTRRL